MSWGPRWLTDILPVLVWILAPAPLVLRPIARVFLVLAMVAAVGVQTIGAFWYTQASDQRIFAGDPTSKRAAWDLRNVPFLTEFRHPHARGDLQCAAAGSIDRVGATQFNVSEEVPILEPGAMLEGWMFTCGRKPAKLLLLIDGIEVGSTREFQMRTGVDEPMHAESKLDWRVSANTTGVSPGERVLQLAVRIEPNSDTRIVREQRVIVINRVPDGSATMPHAQPSQADLEAMAQGAALLLRQRQTEPGFWLTSHTQGLSYEAPQEEMNTFTTSMLVDLLSPVARQRGLDDVVERARRHLAAQIESNGLVRYHGLPDGPTIGKLGCVITPDADDTALVWRIAGQRSGDAREKGMLSELARYRDARGLYRTWLAPQKQYQCIDPGSDPNPTDVAIQMNVYLMLHELDPPAARNLCDALQRSFWDGDIWTYYSKAPLVPYLRGAELGQLGCRIPLPTERLALPARGQEIWSEAMHRLVTTIAAPPDPTARQATANLLMRLGADDFAQVRQTPPLLYHNDLSATVRRFYWSEDFGYALWLRLYDASLETRPLH